ncbi:hypothetical protein DSECCO2_600320 [anaerobic digester metagenome]
MIQIYLQALYQSIRELPFDEYLVDFIIAFPRYSVHNAVEFQELIELVGPDDSCGWQRDGGILKFLFVVHSA